MSLKIVNSSIKLSAIVPIGGFPNGDSLLKSWASSDLPQGLEIIFVVDSDDELVKKSVEEVKIFKPEQKIEVLTSEGRNPGTTREIGLRAATGRWVCFWDADDLPEIANIWRNIESEENRETDVIVGEYRCVNLDTKHTIEYVHRTKDPLMTVFLNPGLWRFVFKRTILQNISFPALRMGEDQVFLLRTLNKSTNIKFVKERFYNYYIYSSGQLTKSKNIFADLRKARELCKEIYPSRQQGYILLAIMRQNFTLIKRGSLSLRISALKDLILFSARSRHNLGLLFRVLVMVQRDK